MESVLLQVLQQGAAGRMNDALRNTRRARRKQHIERMAERKPFERQRLRLERRDEISESLAARDRGRKRCAVAGIGYDQRRHCKARGDRAHLHVDVLALAVIPVAVAGDEQLRRDLAEPIENALLAEIGRAGRPDRPDRGGRQHQRDGFRHVRHHRRDAIARADALRFQRLL
ncbi:hypothetical protein D9M72_512400 [compost metagenome]